MKTIIGVVLFIFGIALGLYFGVWWGFIGGIVQVVEAFKAPDISAMQVAIGLLRWWASSLIGIGAGLIPCAIGASLIK